jgi:hypothetical protein
MNLDDIRSERRALERGEIDKLPQLIAEYPDVLAEFVEREFMHAAAEGNNVEGLEMLLKAGLEIDQPNDNAKESPLDAAIDGEAVDAARWLLEHGACVDGITPDGDSATPLISAAMDGNVELIQLLLDHGANVHRWYSLNGPTLNALNVAENEEVAELLRQHGARMPEEAEDSSREPANDAEGLLAFLEEHYGPPNPLALREIVPSSLPIAIQVFPQSDRLALVTTGMSEEAMQVPKGEDEDFQFAELVMELPPDWPATEDALKKPEHAWPYQWLRALARYPHESGEYYGSYAYTSCDIEELAAQGTKFEAALIFAAAEFVGSKSIALYQVVPLFREECELVKTEGLDAILDLFGEHGIEFTDPRRTNVALGKFPTKKAKKTPKRPRKKAAKKTAKKKAAKKRRK